MTSAGQPLAGKRALVTGAGMGIGRGIALELARQGASVVLHYGHSRAGAEEAAAAITAAGGTAFTVQGDLRLPAECRRVVDSALAQLGGLDSLVNNAGVTREQPFVDTEEAFVDEMIDLNIKGYFYCAQEALPSLLAGHGAILN
ncbi:MAG: SDR family NAD(P)-dependent oxidoreductase, partial [Chloroflexota bacterium]